MTVSFTLFPGSTVIVRVSFHVSEFHTGSLDSLDEPDKEVAEPASDSAVGVPQPMDTQETLLKRRRHITIIMHVYCLCIHYKWNGQNNGPDFCECHKHVDWYFVFE